jgi:hypothetical protein
MDNHCIAKPINRYKLGTSLRGDMKLDPDGCLTLYIQTESPGPDKEAHWLPSPQDDVYFVLRTYMPGLEIMQREWEPPRACRRTYTATKGRSTLLVRPNGTHLWRARMPIDDQPRLLGRFAMEIDVAVPYDCAAVALFGKCP